MVADICYLFQHFDYRCLDRDDNDRDEWVPTMDAVVDVESKWKWECVFH